MTIQPINEYDIALFIGKNDLAQRGLSPEKLSVDDARQMAREAFCSAGIECGRSLEIEAFASSCGVLVFARKALREPYVYAFSNFEDMLEAVTALGEPGCEASVIHFCGKWYISTRERRGVDVLDEYAPRLEESFAFTDHLREHGVTVLDNANTGILRAHFA